ncbi:MAG: methyltransferase domain-containing protein [Crocinitomicaceae bacterium]|nr:methyltransferase domain-containing protein [Crocinitomicaceae bacterium]
MKQEDYYIPQKLTKYNYNVYTTRLEIVEFIKASSHHFSGSVLDAGCGNKPYEPLIKNNQRVTAYFGMDLENSDIYHRVPKELIWDGVNIPLANDEVQTVLATELLEHCFDTDKIVSEFYRVLSSEGKLIGTVPFIWPLHETPHDFYRFTPFSLQQKLQLAGFRDIQITPFGGRDKMLSVSLAIWLVNHPGSKLKKRILRFFILPLIRRLNRKDKPNSDLTQENNIFIGLGFTARK